VRQAIPSAVATALLAGCFFFVTHDWARSLTGGTYVGPDDIGAKASVTLYYRGKPFCGGVVFQDRYILTTAHCLTDGRGHIEKSAKGIEVRYWGSENPKRQSLRARLTKTYRTATAIRDRVFSWQIRTAWNTMKIPKSCPIVSDSKTVYQFWWDWCLNIQLRT
jgi:hypothetical protein